MFTRGFALIFRTLLIAVWTSSICSASFAQLYSNVLQNPGFESGANNSHAEHWTLFNNAYRTTEKAREGTYAMVAWGNWWPAGAWNASGAYQLAPASAGEIWEGSAWICLVTALHGRVFAAVNIEFLSDETSVLLTAVSAARVQEGTPTGQWFKITARSEAPPGTHWVRIVPVFLQSPDFEQGFAYFDDCALYRVPTATVQFAGMTWKLADGHMGPGPNHFSSNSITIDEYGRLHMEVRRTNGVWECAMLTATQSLGYGTYRWYVDSPVDELDTNLVCGLFIYKPEEVYGTNQIEVDIEFSRAWTESAATSVTYTVQPYTIPGNAQAFYMVLTNSPSTHEFDWRPDRVRFRSWFGHSREPEEGALIADWTHDRRGIPIECGEVPVMNLWIFPNRYPTELLTHEVIITGFEFEPFLGWILTDAFDDTETNAMWDVVATPPARVYEAAGLHIQPAPFSGPAGYATRHAVRRNERGNTYVCRALLTDIIGAGSGTNEAIRVLLTLSAQTNNALRAPHAAILEAGYIPASDALKLRVFTKTNAPLSEGILRFEGLASNITAHLSNGGIELRLLLDPDNYAAEVRSTSDGNAVAMTTLLGAPQGQHMLGENLQYSHVFVGAYCPAQSATLVYRGFSCGVMSQACSQIRLRAAMSEDGETPVLICPTVFDSPLSVWATTNLNHPFQLVESFRSIFATNVLFSIPSNTEPLLYFRASYP